MGRSSGRRRRHINLGAASIAVGGAAFALVQILQSSIGAFNPRPVVSVLIAVCAALAGSTLGRMRQDAVEARRLTSLLRVWPLPPLTDCSPLTLGVFPARQLENDDAIGGSSANDPLPPYVPREIDDGLRSALKAGGLVIVVGPQRAGKSRTAYEASRAVLGDRPAVIPVDGSALAELANGSWSGLSDAAVWWLDDLERFLDEMDGTELSLVADPDLQVVATLREERWQSLLHGVGDDGERGRRLRGAAQVFHLAAELTDAEGVDAAPLLATIEPRRVLGETVSAPPEGPIPRQAPDKPPPRRPHDPALGLVAAVTVAAIAALVLVIGGGGFSPAKPPSIAAQVDAIRQHAADAGKVTLTARAVHLHGFDQQSYVFVMQPVHQGSDELRVYDVVDGRLTLRLDFQPHSTKRMQPDTTSVVEYKGHVPIYDQALEDLQVRDVFGNGEQQVLGDYTQLPLGQNSQLPVIVSWDDIAQRYRLQTLLTRPPAAAPHFQSDGLEPRVSLRDRATGIVLRGWSVSAYELSEAGGASSASLTIGDEVFGPHNKFGLQIGSYSLTPAAGGVNVASPHTCYGATVLREGNLTDAEVLHRDLSQSGRVPTFPMAVEVCTG